MQTGTINCINWTFNFSQQYQGSALEQYIHLFESIKPAAHTTSKISTGRPDTAEVLKYSCSVHDHGSLLELFNFDTIFEVIVALTNTCADVKYMEMWQGV